LLRWVLVSDIFEVFLTLDEAGERCIDDIASRPIVIAIEAMPA